MPGFKCQSKVLVCRLRVVCALSVFAILSLSRTNAGAPTHGHPAARTPWMGAPGTFIQNAASSNPNSLMYQNWLPAPTGNFVIVCS
jgi:hypothetical protein